MKTDNMPQPELRQTVRPSSTWRPLANPNFRNLLIANLASDIGTFMQSVGAAWLMTSLTKNTLYVALIQTAGALPFFLIALPAGSLGDIVDRRKLLLTAEIWMLAIAGVLAAVTIEHWATPWLLFLFTFGLAAGDAVEAPSWRAMLPSLADKEDLPAAIALNGIEFNLARAVGPGLAGMVVASIGVAAAFVINALSFLGVIYVVAKWKQPIRRSQLPPETLRSATVAAIRYARYSPPVQRILLRAAILIFFVSSFWALLPVVAREISTSAVTYGLLVGSFGLGAVLGVVALSRARARYSSESIMLTATLLFAGVLSSMTLIQSMAFLVPILLVGGACWTSFMSLFNILVQDLAPVWVRARVISLFLLVFQGSIALGSAVWGFVGLHSGLHFGLIFAAVGAALSSSLAFLLPLPKAPLDLSQWNHWIEPTMFEEPLPEHGPVLVNVIYEIDAQKTEEFLAHLYEYGTVRRRDGATRWEVFYDTAIQGVFLESFLVDTWAEHARQHDRFTTSDKQLEEAVLRFAQKAPVVTHYLSAH